MQIAVAPKLVPRPFFRDKLRFVISQSAGELRFVGLLTHASGLGTHDILRLPRPSPSGWLSPKEDASAFTAAAPSGIRTRFPCSAEAVLRRFCHETVSNCLIYDSIPQGRCQVSSRGRGRDSSTNCTASTSAGWNKASYASGSRRTGLPAGDRPSRPAR